SKSRATWAIDCSACTTNWTASALNSGVYLLRFVDIDSRRPFLVTTVYDKCHTPDNVHRIFQSLNNTGLKLTQGDLLRNYYFMRLPTLGPTAYEKLWLPMQRRLDSSEIESLFWNDCVHRDHRIKQDDVFVT